VQETNNWILLFKIKEEQYKTIVKCFDYINKHIKVVKKVIKKI